MVVVPALVQPDARQLHLELKGLEMIEVRGRLVGSEPNVSPTQGDHPGAGLLTASLAA